MKLSIAFAETIVALGLLGTAVQAGQILTIDDVNGNLGTANTSTGAATLIGNAGHGVVLTDIAFNSSGQLFGTDFTNLYSVNKTTGAATLIAALSNNISGGANGLTFGPNGSLYASSYTSSQLYTVNTTTGVATAIGSISGVGYTSSGDLAFNGGNLYLTANNNNGNGADKLIKITLNANGTSVVSATNLGSTGFNNVFGLATGADGVLYGVAGTQVITLNTTTGAGTLDSNYGSPLAAANGATIAPSVTSPEPATFGLLGMNAACLLAYALQKRPRNKDFKE